MTGCLLGCLYVLSDNDKLAAIYECMLYILDFEDSIDTKVKYLENSMATLNL